MAYAKRRTVLLIASSVIVSILPLHTLAQESELVECTLYFQPESSQVHHVEAGDRITLTVHVWKSDPPEGRALGIAVGLEILDLEKHHDHIKCRVKALPEQREVIDRARKINQLWFIYCKYRPDEHDRVFEEGPDFEEFLDDHPEYQGCDERHWGLGGRGPQIPPPDFLLNENFHDNDY